MKTKPAFPGGEVPQDTLSLYLALEKRVQELENELSFTKLVLNSLYREIKDLKKEP